MYVSLKMAIQAETCCSIKTTKVCESERRSPTRSDITHQDATLQNVYKYVLFVYVCRMYQSVLVLLVTALCVDSLTVYGSYKTFVFNMSDHEDESSLSDSNREPPPHSEVAKMARYIVHNSGGK
jgi:hypothetical protein